MRLYRGIAGCVLVHLWGDRVDATVNAFSEPSEWVSPFPTPLDVVTTEDNATSLMPPPPAIEGDELLSTWSNQRTFRPPKALPPIDCSLIPDLKWKDFIGYAPVPPGLTGRPPASAAASIIADSKTLGVTGVGRGASLSAPLVGARNSLSLYRKFTASRKATEKARRKRDGVKSFTEALSLSLRSEMTIPAEYARVKINIPKYGLSTFDFSAYNLTQFTGLDNLLPNSYCNALLQVLYFIPMIRTHCRNHLCYKESCLTCELGFLFRMISPSPAPVALLTHSSVYSFRVVANFDFA